MREQKHHADIDVSSYGYQGLPIFANPGVHEGVEDILRNHCTTPGKVLDIAAGTGSFSKRLQNLGFEVQANEFDLEVFQVRDIPCWSFDLNDELPIDDEVFDLICAIEIIEHLENPLHFLRECLKILKSGGYLIVTTPNIVSSLSYVRFLSALIRKFDDVFL